MSSPAQLLKMLETEVQRLKAENQRLVDECIRFGLEIAIREEEDRFKRALLPAAGPNLRMPLPDYNLFKQG
jgi:hypothetical protein